MVQQFLGIINYIRDFLPHVDQHTSVLSALLKKNPMSWDSSHTAAVQQLKNPWADFQSLLETQETQYTVTEPGSLSTPTQAQRAASPELVEDILISQELQRAKKEYEKETGDVLPTWLQSH